ncbi:MAG: nickel-responsive transcriptional regulator NikR [Bryobacterales bacterium]|nr:nickel-responsive transcriptional regulator NikR [Bryobacterales bacterium]
MSGLSRIGVAIEQELLARFDEHIASQGYTNRSEAFRDLIRADLTRAASEDDTEMAYGSLTLLYDHHVPQLSGRLTQIQHDSDSKVLSTMHVHITHHLCLEVIVLRGKAGELRALAGALGSLRGVQHATLDIAKAGDIARHGS